MQVPPLPRMRSLYRIDALASRPTVSSSSNSASVEFPLFCFFSFFFSSFPALRFIPRTPIFALAIKRGTINPRRTGDARHLSLFLVLFRSFSSLFFSLLPVGRSVGSALFFLFLSSRRFCSFLLAEAVRFLLNRNANAHASRRETRQVRARLPLIFHCGYKLWSRRVSSRVNRSVGKLIKHTPADCSRVLLVLTNLAVLLSLSRFTICVFLSPMRVTFGVITVKGKVLEWTFVY